ncbi:MAG: tyrosine--tRNA ligase [Eubacteriales bacterium]
MENKTLFDTLNERGYIYQCTNTEKVKEIINGKPMTFYLGIDPTADSLHIGHFFALMMFRYLQRAGHKGILVIGGATALIGDPSGKSDMRKMLTKEQVEKNVQEVKNLASRFIRMDGENPAEIHSNTEWMRPYDYIDFMRDIGVHFNVNTMLSADAYANRIKEGGLTFLEMGYMLMQAYDFVYLNRTKNCVLQIGGSDQWGNIVAGTMLNRKMKYISDDDVSNDNNIFGLTCPLLLTKEGKKMGKTEKGTLWIARDKTTPFDFYQYFYNIDDENVETLLKLFTEIDMDTIKELCSTDIIKAKRTMAYEITKLVHGKEEADKVIESVNALFGSGNNIEHMPKADIEKSKVEGTISVIDLLVEVGFMPSKSEARRMIQQNAVSVGGNKITDVGASLTLDDFKDGYVIAQKGKKNFIKINLK